jgi:dTDP-glucose 4,6-dehydratase
MNGTAGDIYNIGSGIHLSNLELVLKIMEIMNISSKSIEFVKDRLGHDVSYRINSDKIKALGHQNQIGFDLGILDCVNWYSSNLRWWKNLI